jgi:excisionase family DNA binding protein
MLENKEKPKMPAFDFSGSASKADPDDARSLPQRIERMKRAMTAGEIAGFLAVSPITVYKMAKAGRMPSFRIGSAVRFDPRAVAEWLRGNSPWSRA